MSLPHRGSDLVAPTKEVFRKKEGAHVTKETAMHQQQRKCKCMFDVQIVPAFPHIISLIAYILLCYTLKTL